jgi:hypothetical protein
MKYLLRVLFILALFCGVTSHAHASDFHAQVLDPTCENNNSACTLNLTDLGTSFPITLTETNCAAHNITGPSSGDFGCFVGTNQTGGPITSFNLDFTGSVLTGATCDTDLTNTGIGLPPGGIAPAFSITGCSPDGAGGFDLTFSGGAITDTNQFIILEVGVDPSDIGASAVANPVPEPDSLLLLSTGAMMMTAGMFLNKRRRFAFLKK